MSILVCSTGTKLTNNKKRLANSAKFAARKNWLPPEWTSDLRKFTHFSVTMRLHIALVVLLALALVQSKPVDDDTPADSDSGAKKENVDKTEDDSGALSDSPITDPSPDSGDKRELSLSTTTTTIAPDLLLPSTTTTTTLQPDDTTTTTTVAPTTTTVEPDQDVTTTTTAAPDVDEPTVEGSENNTRTMKGTTYHVAIQDKSVEFYDEMNTNLHDVHRHAFATYISDVYKDYQDYKQAVIIKFSKPDAKENKDTATRALAKEGTVVDMYLRFFNPGKHLNKLTDALKTGKLSTHDVHPVFIRAYVAEPTGLVCTPDCKVQCYSYCDAGCCHVNIVQNIEMPTPSPVEQFIADQQLALKTGITTPKPCTDKECKEMMQQQQQQQQPMMMPMPMMMPAPCQGAACPPPMMPMMPSPMMAAPCQGAACGAPMMPPQMPCQGAACPPPMMPMMPPPQMPCQGAACGAPMMPPMMPSPQMCPPSCSQVCGPSCPNQCCGGSMSQPGMNQQQMPRRQQQQQQQQQQQNSQFGR